MEVSLLLEKREVGLILEHRADGLLVELAVGLGARGPHRRPLARVQCAELNAGTVRGARHGAAQGIDFPDQVPLADSPDRRIAAHLPQCLDALGEQERAHAHARGGQRRFGAGVAAADDNDVIGLRKTHVRAHFSMSDLRCRAACGTGPRGKSHAFCPALNEAAKAVC